MLRKVESGKCRRVTAATDGICLNTGRMHKCPNRKITLSRPENVYWDNVVFFSTNDGDSKRKTSPIAAPFRMTTDRIPCR